MQYKKNGVKSSLGFKVGAKKAIAPNYFIETDRDKLYTQFRSRRDLQICSSNICHSEPSSCLNNQHKDAYFSMKIISNEKCLNYGIDKI
jgi:hypothetical protein